MTFASIFESVSRLTKIPIPSVPPCYIRSWFHQKPNNIAKHPILADFTEIVKIRETASTINNAPIICNHGTHSTHSVIHKHPTPYDHIKHIHLLNSPKHPLTSDPTLLMEATDLPTSPTQPQRFTISKPFLFPFNPSFAPYHFGPQISPLTTFLHYGTASNAAYYNPVFGLMSPFYQNAEKSYSLLNHLLSTYRLYIQLHPLSPTWRAELQRTLKDKALLKHFAKKELLHHQPLPNQGPTVSKPAKKSKSKQDQGPNRPLPPPPEPPSHTFNNSAQQQQPYNASNNQYNQQFNQQYNQQNQQHNPNQQYQNGQPFNQAGLKGLGWLLEIGDCLWIGLLLLNFIAEFGPIIVGVDILVIALIGVVVVVHVRMLLLMAAIHDVPLIRHDVLMPIIVGGGGCDVVGGCNMVALIGHAGLKAILRRLKLM
jgi:hypothetical protein